MLRKQKNIASERLVNTTILKIMLKKLLKSIVDSEINIIFVKKNAMNKEQIIDLIKSKEQEAYIYMQDCIEHLKSDDIAIYRASAIWYELNLLLETIEDGETI